MSNQVPFTAFCPECNGHRTFTLTGSAVRSLHIGCCICGTSEREALAALSGRMLDDRDTLGQMAARLNTLDGELAELRDEVHALASPGLHSVKVVPTTFVYTPPRRP